MFTRDASFFYTHMLTDPEFKRTGEEVAYSTTTVDAARNGYPVELRFSGTCYNDGHWRIKVSGDRCASVQFSGVGEPLVEFLLYHTLFVSHFAKSDRALGSIPWPELEV